MVCCDATPNSFVAKVQGEVFAHFHAVVLKCQSSVNSPLDDVHALDFTLHLSCLYWFW
jgi:hypothetical protein